MLKLEPGRGGPEHRTTDWLIVVLPGVIWGASFLFIAEGLRAIGPNGVTFVDAEVARIAAALHDTYKVDRVAPGHCTGEPAFYRFKKTWKERYLYAGVGSVIQLEP